MQETNNRKTEEIPSISFSKLLWIFFDALLRFVRHTIQFLYKNRLLLLAFLFVGLVIGAVIYKISKPRYSISMMVKHTELNARTFGQMLEDLNRLVGSGSSIELSKTLNLPVSTSSKLVSVSGKNMEGISLQKDTTQQNNRTFIIDLVVTDNKVSDTLQNALLGYFNNNPFLSKLKQDRIQLKNDRLGFINTELSKLDSLKMVYNQFLSTSGNSSMFYNNAFNPVDLYKQSDSYQTEKNNIEEWLRQSSQSIISIDGTTPAAIPKSMGLITSMLLYGVLFFLFGCLFAAVAAVVKTG